MAKRGLGKTSGRSSSRPEAPSSASLESEQADRPISHFAPRQAEPVAQDERELHELLAYSDAPHAHAEHEARLATDFFSIPPPPPVHEDLEDDEPPPRAPAAPRAMWLTVGMLIASLALIGGFLGYHQLVMPQPAELGSDEPVVLLEGPPAAMLPYEPEPSSGESARAEAAEPAAVTSAPAQPDGPAPAPAAKATALASDAPPPTAAESLAAATAPAPSEHAAESEPARREPGAVLPPSAADVPRDSAPASAAAPSGELGQVARVTAAIPGAPASVAPPTIAAAPASAADAPARVAPATAAAAPPTPAAPSGSEAAPLPSTAAAPSAATPLTPAAPSGSEAALPPSTAAAPSAATPPTSAAPSGSEAALPPSASAAPSAATPPAASGSRAASPPSAAAASVPLVVPAAVASPASEPSFEQLLEQAEGLSQRGQSALAVAAFERALQRKPGAPVALAGKAFAHLNLNDREAAKAFAEQAVAADPTSSRGWIVLGAAEDQLGARSAAQAAYRHCAEQGVGHYVSECKKLVHPSP